MTKTTSSSVWEAVSQWLPLASPDLEYWWKLTGPRIAHMMEAAEYSVEDQYNALLFHHSWIVIYPSLHNYIPYQSIKTPVTQSTMYN